jgi:Tfp pilus assembly protein PilN
MLSVALLVVGFMQMMRGSKLDAQIASLEAEADRARGRVAEIAQLEKRLASIQQNRERLNNLLNELPSRPPSLLLGTAG